MRRLALLAVCAGLGCAALSGCGSDAGAAEFPAATRSAAAKGDVLHGTYPRLNGARDNLSRYRGKVVLVVNTATACGFTRQFEGLQRLYSKRKARGLVLLGFPSNDFASQEPRSNTDIASFCKKNFGVTFPMFAKSKVVGSGANPLFGELTKAAGAPEWNFNKYLLDRRGRVVARWGAGTEPDAPELLRRIERLL